MIATDWRPRDYQKPLWRYLKGGGKRAIAVWHRRAGKDTTALWWTREALFERPGLYWHMLPSLRQGRLVVWDAVDYDGRRLVDKLFPPETRKPNGLNEAEMRIDCMNGGSFMVVGSDNYNALVGANPMGIVFSEWALADPAAWEYVRPILAENNGWAAFLYTPRGRNHGWKLYDDMRRDGDWFTELLTADDTGSISEDAIEAERKGGMTDAMIRQEFYCSFEAPLFGSYYADELMRADAEKRICSVPSYPEASVDTWWDLGFSDQTAIWFVQYVGHEVHLIDYYETSGEGLSHYARILKEKADKHGYVYGEHIAPHDAEWGELGTGKTRVDSAREHGIVFRIAPKISVADGIEAVRNMLARCWFDADKCARGIECLRSYRKARDVKNDTWKDRPTHDWASHGADAARYGAVAGKGYATSHSGPLDYGRRRAV